VKPSTLSLRSIAWLLAALMLYAVALTLIEMPLDLEHFRAVFSERGPFERLSPPFWLLLALTMLLAAWRLPRVPALKLATVGLVPVLFAMREADWHYKLAGENVLKLKFYAHGIAPLHVKIVAGVIVVLGLAVLLRTLHLGYRHLRTANAYSQTWTWSLLIGVATLIGTKVLDRSINLAGEWFGLVWSESTGHLIGAYEEGFECALPLIFMVALVQYLQAQPYSLTRSGRAGVTAAGPTLSIDSPEVRG